MKSLILGLILVSLILSGCVIFQGEQNISNNTTPPPPSPPKNPSLIISTPISGEVLIVSEDIRDVPLVLSTQNFLLKQPGSAAKTGEGHFRITVDDSEPFTSTTKSNVIPNLAFGEHTIKVEIINNDRTTYNPPIVKFVTFVIEPQEPAEYVPQAYTVNMLDFSYEPAQTTVKVKDTVTFTNTGKFPNSATCIDNGRPVFDTQILAPAASATITMNEMMVCDFYSTTNRAMTGRVIVENNGVDD